jgi:RNA polymerase sigma-70 factor, ECF subfamily
MHESQPAGPSDEELVRRFQQDPHGDEGRTAAGELLGRYRRTTYLWCFRMVTDHDTALDLAQDALIDAYRGLHRFQARSRFSSWLFMVVRNRCRTALRPRSLTRDDDADPDLLEVSGSDPEAVLIDKQSAEALERLLLDHLSPLEQDAIWLRCVERLSVGEVTRILGIESASGARGLLQTARRKLRAALERPSTEEGLHDG